MDRLGLNYWFYDGSAWINQVLLINTLKKFLLYDITADISFSGSTNSPQIVSYLELYNSVGLN